MADILTALRDEWPRVGRSKSSQLAAARLSEAYPDLELPSTDLFDVVDILERRGTRTAETKAEIIQVLLHEATDRAVHRALLQTLIPGLVNVCRQLQFGQGYVNDRNEAVSVATSMLTELLNDWAGQTRQYAAGDVLSALRGRLRRYLIKEKSSACGQLDDGMDHGAPEPSMLLTRLESLRGGQYDRLVKLTYARVFEGCAMKDLATMDHSGYVSLRAELQAFAVRHLIA